MGNRLDGADQPARDPARTGVGGMRPDRGREPRPGPRRGVRARVGHRARLRQLRGAARRPGRRGRLHLPTELASLRVVDPRARGGQARALREAHVASRGGGRGGLRRGRPDRAPADGGVHVAAPPAGAEAGRARRGRRDRPAPGDPFVVRLRALRPDERAASPRDRRRGAHGCRLLLRQRLALPWRRAPARRGRAGRRPDRGRHPVRGRHADGERRHGPLRLQLRGARSATSSR